ncbi:MAG: DUF192 domain-containing protein [Candidatus Omnitrophota bacterium]|nr:MAG: DUF192 domain-containing protein [Candidatus Omnitrophota bacterium]
MIRIKNFLLLSITIIILCISIAALSSPLRPVLVGNKLVFVEFARTRAEQSFGLKNRQELGKDRGMLFIFPVERFLKFWMKDTLIPLSIVFIDRNRTIIDIQHMLPRQTAIIYTSKKKAKYALEMNVHWFENNDVNIGDKVRFWR